MYHMLLRRSRIKRFFGVVAVGVIVCVGVSVYLAYGQEVFDEVFNSHTEVHTSVSIDEAVASTFATMFVTYVSWDIDDSDETDNNVDAVEEANEAEENAEVTKAVYPLSSESASSILAFLDALTEAEDGLSYAVLTADGIATTEVLEIYSEVAHALSAFAELGYQASFVLYDFETSCALAYNLDYSYYCASTIKGPFVTYLTESVVGGALASFDELLEEQEIIGGTGIMYTDDVSIYALSDVMANAILYSDNTAYRMLWRLYGGSGFAAWAATCGVDASSWDGAEYPSLSVRELAKLWIGIGRYLGSDDSSAAWLTSLYKQSGYSFLRTALGDKATVLSKPGFDSNMWYDTENDKGALHDAGIIESSSGNYLLVIMSNADYDSRIQTEYQELFVNLAQALSDVQASWAVRYD